MPKQRLIKALGLYRQAIRHSGQNGLPMRLRLFLFLVLFLNTIMLGVLLILFTTGVFRAGLREHRPVLGNELTHIAQDIYRSFGAVSVQTVDLAKELSVTLERNLTEHGGEAAALQASTDLLEPLLADELSRLTGALEKSGASGVFLLLDATVNPALPNAANSRACLYLKNMEPNIVNGMAANLHFGIGPMSIARNHGIYLLPQWQMEMDVGLSHISQRPWPPQGQKSVRSPAFTDGARRPLCRALASGSCFVPHRLLLRTARYLASADLR